MSSQVYHQQQQQQQQQQHHQQQHQHQQHSMHHAAAGVTGQPLLIQPVPGDYLTGTFQHYRPLTTSRQRYRTYPPMATATPYSGYLLHFLAMLGRPATVVSTTLPHHRASLQHEDFTELDSYEALLNLAERLGEVKSRGLTRPDIDRLRCYRYEGAGNSEMSASSTLDQTSCVVCLCDFEPRELVRSLPCQHEFHARCVDKWLKMNRTCPLCRADVTEPMSSPTKMDIE
jgi:E3 ubiquitin-protein ligase RNF38/44